MASIRAILARASKFITDIKSDTDWNLYATIFDVDDIANRVTRLYRSQSFEDPDYPSCVNQFFQDIAEKDDNLAIDFVKYIISNDFNLKDEEIISKDPELLKGLGLLGKYEVKIPDFAPLNKKYIDIKVLPGDFYLELQEQINKAFAYGIFPAVQILSRKFLENLIVDILRKKYGMQRVELFFDVGRRRFHGFEQLLRNLDERIDDFIGISQAFDSSFLSKVNRFREQGNSSAHTIELNLEINDIENDGSDLEFIIKVLIKVFDSI